MAMGSLTQATGVRRNGRESGCERGEKCPHEHKQQRFGGKTGHFETDGGSTQP